MHAPGNGRKVEGRSRIPATQRITACTRPTLACCVAAAQTEKPRETSETSHLARGANQHVGKNHGDNLLAASQRRAGCRTSGRAPCAPSPLAYGANQHV